MGWTKIGLLNILAVVFYLAGANVVNAETLSDSTGDWFVGATGEPSSASDYIDIVSADITKSGSNLILKIKVNGNIPSFGWQGYHWQFDTDKNSGTGQSGSNLNNDIGTDYYAEVHGIADGRIVAEVRPLYDENGNWVPEGQGTPISYTISGDTITATISLADIGNPTSFYWIAGTTDGIQTNDKVPNSGHGSFTVQSSASYSITNLNMNGQGSYIEAKPGATISGTVDYVAWDDTCSGCIHQLVLGVGDEPKTCVYDAVPGGYPGVSGTASFSFKAPTEPGTYTVGWTEDAMYTCDDAKNNFPGKTKTPIGTIKVVVPSGMLRVETSPVSGKIYVNGVYKGTGSWSGSLPASSYTVSFREVSGYITPSPQIVTVIGGQTTNVTGEYIVANWHSVANLDMNGRGNYIKVKPGEHITATVDYEKWDSTCPGCIHQIGVGLDDSPIGCIYNDIPGGYPGVSGTATFTFRAPEEPGTYTVGWTEDAMYTCSDAMANFASKPKKKIGTVEVISEPGRISVSTNLEDATFTITGPETYSGSGTSWSKSNVPVGTYTIHYGDVPGYSTPPPETKKLASGGEIEFRGTYRDIEEPQISLESPEEGQSFESSRITVRGKASDNAGVSRVEVRVNDEPWEPATGTSSWSREVTLQSGQNLIGAKAVDTTGNTKTAYVRVYYNPKAVDSDGDGWIDEYEREIGTDPHNKDTDGDGYWDPKDPNPLDPAIPEKLKEEIQNQTDLIKKQTGLLERIIEALKNMLKVALRFLGG